MKNFKLCLLTFCAFFLIHAPAQAENHCVCVERPNSLIRDAYELVHGNDSELYLGLFSGAAKCEASRATNPWCQKPNGNQKLQKVDYEEGGSDVGGGRKEEGEEET